MRERYDVQLLHPLDAPVPLLLFAILPPLQPVIVPLPPLFARLGLLFIQIRSLGQHVERDAAPVVVFNARIPAFFIISAARSQHLQSEEQETGGCKVKCRKGGLARFRDVVGRVIVVHLSSGNGLDLGVVARGESANVLHRHAGEQLVPGQDVTKIL